jgi:lysophospholipase L1-like esterase
MNAKLRYLAGAAVSLPLLPLLYFHGKAVRKSVPDLPEAKGSHGLVDNKAAKTLHVLTIGESTIAGVGVDNHEEGFTGLLASRLSDLLAINVKWKVYAKSGYTVSSVRQKLIPTIKEKRIDLIVIGLGANDAFTLNRPSKWAQEAEALINDLRTMYPDAPIGFINMPPIKEFPAFTRLIKFTIGNLVEMHGIALAKVVSKYDNVFYNPQIILLDDWVARLGNNLQPSDLFSDGVHPSKLSYQAWGNDFAEFLVREKVIS